MQTEKDNGGLAHRRARLLLLAAVLVLCLAAFGCSSPLEQRMRRSDGLLDFLAGRPGELIVPVHTRSSRGGNIESAYVRVQGGVAYVCGQVSRGFGIEPEPGAHIDVSVLSSAAEAKESHSAEYYPRSIPPVRRRISYARYTVRLNAVPSAGEIVQVVFHNRLRVPATPCILAHSGQSSPSDSKADLEPQ